MASVESVKRALNSNPKMSLNERFQLLRRQNVASNRVMQNTPNRQTLRQGSQKNRRLALQMANRPSVLAALRAGNTPKPLKTRSVKQRLGIKRNINTNVNRNMNRNMNRNVNQMILKRKPINRSNFNNNVNQNTGNRQRFANRIQNTGAVGLRPKVGLKNRFRRGQALKSSPYVAKTGLKGKRRVGQQQVRQNQAKTGGQKGFRLNRNFKNRNTGKQNQLKGGKRGPVKPNREQLDNDLDAYMAKTRGHLDAELDAYMSQTN